MPHRNRIRFAALALGFVAGCQLLAGCGDDENPAAPFSPSDGGPQDTGGSAGTGGKVGGTGGKVGGAGGKVGGTGGKVGGTGGQGGAGGGAAGAGGTGGTGTGGTGTGGTGTGGAETGGAGTGGAGTGGAGTGGAGTGGAGTGGAATGGTDGGAGTGGAGTGGAGTGGAGTGGAGTGGAGTGGAGTGGAGTGGGAGADGGLPPGASPCTTGTPSTSACLACEANLCPHDVDFQPYCQDFTSGADQASCQAVLDCVRNSGCIAFGNVACYCGAATPVGTCKSTPGAANGLCKAEIETAFASTDSNLIVNNIGVVTIPGGAALSLAQCDFANCGDPGNGGNNECVPYCK